MESANSEVPQSSSWRFAYDSSLVFHFHSIVCSSLVIWIKLSLWNSFRKQPFPRLGRYSVVVGILLQRFRLSDTYHIHHVIMIVQNAAENLKSKGEWYLLVNPSRRKYPRNQA